MKKGDMRSLDYGSHRALKSRTSSGLFVKTWKQRLHVFNKCSFGGSGARGLVAVVPFTPDCP